MKHPHRSSEVSSNIPKDETVLTYLLLPQEFLDGTVHHYHHHHPSQDKDVCKGLSCLMTTAHTRMAMFSKGLSWEIRRGEGGHDNRKSGFQDMTHSTPGLFSRKELICTSSFAVFKSKTKTVKH